MLSFVSSRVLSMQLLMLLQVHAFLTFHDRRSIVIPQQQRDFLSFYYPKHYSPYFRHSVPLFMATADLDSTDPFAVLGLDPSPALNKKDIKRAYKRMALKYHPDMVTNKDSSTAEKKSASDRFTRINWAYETLIGKDASSSAASSSSSTTTSSSSSGWTPPHRRSGAYSSSSRTTTSSSSGSSSSYGSTDWRDYMPKYDDEEEYDAGGDSFGAIFSDLFAGAATAAATGGKSGIFRDFVEFLEDNIDGYGGSGDDAELRVLLQTGSLKEIGEEMDETELVVQQLTAKLKSIDDELVMLKADTKVATRYGEKLELEERVAELEARKKVVDGYIAKAQKRLLSLQTRYKQMIVDGDNDPRAGGGRSGGGISWDDIKRESYTSASSPSGTSSTTSSRRTRPESEKKEDSWKDEGFGSFGRGSSRRRSRQRTTTAAGSGSATSSSSSSRSPASDASQSKGSSYSSRAYQEPPRTAQPQTQRPSEPYQPPHRRSSSYSSRMEDDKRRLRELKVDEEFDKLKKDLGM